MSTLIKGFILLIVLVILLSILNWFGMLWHPVVKADVLYGKGDFKAGFAKVDITPDYETRDIYLAGFGHGRRATGVNDPLWARSIVLQSGDLIIGLVVMDLVGLFYDDVEGIRERVYEAIDMDYLIVLTTHNHNSPDTMGIWGKTPLKHGIDPDYQEYVREKASMSVIEAYRAMEDVNITIAQAEIDGLQADSRIPHVYDKRVTTLLFEGKQGVVGSLVHWSNHPEALGGNNPIITSDFPHYVRENMEGNLGGVSLYVNGAIGGLINPLRVKIHRGDGTSVPDNSFEKAKIIGDRVAQTSISSLENAQTLSPSLKVSCVPTYLPESNGTLRLLSLMGVIRRSTYWRGLPVGRLGTHIKTETGILAIGELQIALIPGELFPELFYGGHLNEEAANPHVEPEPILKEHMRGDVNLIFGLANDEIGYIVPANDFLYGTLIGGRRKDRNGRSHYEETVSLGKNTAGLLSEYFIMGVNALQAKE